MVGFSRGGVWTKATPRPGAGVTLSIIPSSLDIEVPGGWDLTFDPTTWYFVTRRKTIITPRIPQAERRLLGKCRRRTDFIPSRRLLLDPAGQSFSIS